MRGCSSRAVIMLSSKNLMVPKATRHGLDKNSFESLYRYQVRTPAIRIIGINQSGEYPNVNVMY